CARWNHGSLDVW
nr:immunoglobulin heavy chain junction region [Macaca mulatta]